MRWRAWLRLGRVSNLPTVATNALAGMVLSGARVSAMEALLVVAGTSSLYVAGMFLNDAFDRDWDRAHRAERPIAQGLVRPAEVFGAGFALLAAGVALVGACGARAAMAAAALAAVIVVYDTWHKDNPLAPALMGLCRALVYVTAALAAGSVTRGVGLGAVVLFLYVVGLSHAARFETLGRLRSLWPLAFLFAPILILPGTLELLGLVLRLGFVAWTILAVWLVRSRKPGAIPAAVMRLIAGISLVDAILLQAAGATGWAIAVALALPLTLRFQRRIAGT